MKYLSQTYCAVYLTVSFGGTLAYLTLVGIQPLPPHLPPLNFSVCWKALFPFYSELGLHYIIQPELELSNTHPQLPK